MDRPGQLDQGEPGVPGAAEWPRPRDSSTRPESRGDGASPLVFVTERGKPLDGKRMCRLLEKHRIAAVPHWFRSSFRDWAAEETDHPREVIEAALAHVVQNRVEAAYRRTDLFERRRRLMIDWEAYLPSESSALSVAPHK